MYLYLFRKLILTLLVVVAAGEPFVFRPSNLGGISYAFIASHDRVMDEHIKGHQRLRDTLPPLPGAIGNRRDYYDFVTTDNRFTYSNVRIITLPHLHFIRIQRNMNRLSLQILLHQSSVFLHASVCSRMITR